MKNPQDSSSRLLLTAVLMVGGFGYISPLHAQKAKPAATPAVDPAAHAAHVASGGMPPDAAKGDPALVQDVSQLQAKIVQLEAALAKGAPPMSAAPAGAAMPGMPAAAPAMSMGMDKMKADTAMPGMRAGATPPPPMAGMGGSASPAAGGMNMMAMMDKMMGMMDKMMSMDSMGGGTMPAAAPMAGGMGMMDMDKMKMSGGGAMPPAPAAGMGMEKMEMAGMMGMGAMKGASPGAMAQSALPGFPGASHLYHIGATGFFLDHSQHIALTVEQQAALNQAKQQALLAKSTADRVIQQAEQELWTLTASDQPDAAKIEGKIVEIAKLTGDERLAFIRAVGEASKLLTNEQRKSLTGFAPPAPTPSMAAPAAAPMAPMKGM